MHAAASARPRAPDFIAPPGYALKTAYRDGTTYIVMEPEDFIARLAALVPPPRMHLARFHGIIAPHNQLRAAITPAGRGISRKPTQAGLL